MRLQGRSQRYHSTYLIMRDLVDRCCSVSQVVLCSDKLFVVIYDSLRAPSPMTMKHHQSCDLRGLGIRTKFEPLQELSTSLFLAKNRQANPSRACEATSSLSMFPVEVSHSHTTITNITIQWPLLLPHRILAIANHLPPHLHRPALTPRKTTRAIFTIPGAG